MAESTVSDAQERYLKRIEEGMGAQAARGVGKAQRGLAARGLGRHVGGQAAVGRLAADYAQRIGETVGGLRAGAEERTAGRAFSAGESAKQRAFSQEQQIRQAHISSALIKQQKKKGALEQIGDVADIASKFF